MKSEVRVLLAAVMGYGSNYLNEFKKGVAGAKLEGIVELQKEALEADPWIREHQIPVYETLEEFYAEHSADLAVISTPIHLHTQFVMKCLERGSNVLCEKPLCLTVKEAMEMQHFADGKNRFLAVGYQRCYNKDVQAVKKEILNGSFGAPVRFQSFQGCRRGMKYYGRNNWAGKIHANGREVFDSPLQNACAHEFQLACFFLGTQMDTACRIERVEAECYRGNPNIENFDIVALCAMTDRKVPIYYYTAHPLDDSWSLRGIYEFEKATVLFGKNEEKKETLSVCYADGSLHNITQEVGYTDQLQKLHDAVAAVQCGGKPICSIYSELAHIEAVRMTQQYPITAIDPSHVEIIKKDDDTLYAVRGLTQKMRQAADAWTLPGKLGISF